MKFNPFSGYINDGFLKDSLQDRFDNAWAMIIGQHLEKKIEQRLGIADYLTAAIPFLLMELADFLLDKLNSLYANKSEDKSESKSKKILRQAKPFFYWPCCIVLAAITIAAFVAKLCVAFVSTFVAVIFILPLHLGIQGYNYFNSDSPADPSASAASQPAQPLSFPLSVNTTVEKNQEKIVNFTIAAPGSVSKLGQFAHADTTQQKPETDPQLRSQPTQ